MMPRCGCWSGCCRPCADSASWPSKGARRSTSSCRTCRGFPWIWDLTYTGLEEREAALANIHAALHEVRGVLEGLGLRVHATPLGGTPSWVKLVVGSPDAQVKVEVSPVLRGAVYPPQLRQTTPAVQARFGFAEVPVLAGPELYAGKLVAALDRQHPRDLYDARRFLGQGGLTRELVC